MRLGLILLMGCGEPTPTITPTPTPTPPVTPVDADNDGVSIEDGDCNDFNDAILPGVDDVVGDGIDQDCDGSDGVDRDGDGFEDAVFGGTDCDDANADISPDAVESCNSIDDDCDGLVDDEDDNRVGDVVFYEDMDGDGFAAEDASEQLACVAYLDWTTELGDCDDQRPSVYTGAPEACNGIDDDCDGLIDVEDEDYGGSTLMAYVDADGDGRGDATTGRVACRVEAGFVRNSDDCDDTDPDAFEFEVWYEDADGDGARGMVIGAECGAPTPSSLLPDAIEDCNDADASVQVVQDWSVDADADGVGGGPITSSCNKPGSAVPVSVGFDCDDTTSDISPLVPERCDDDVDHDCDGSACTVRTCENQQELDPLSTSGTYSLDIDNDGVLRDFWCDMDTDDGGWTRVAFATTAPRDRAQGYFPAIGDDQPDNTRGIFGDFVDVMGPISDIRFSCRQSALSTDWDVDLVFYQSPWYAEVSVGADQQSCFNEPGGYDAPTTRRDLVTGAIRFAGDDWNQGVLIGEPTCFDTAFQVDFDEGGVGFTVPTTWGRTPAGESVCGLGTGEEYAVWVRSSSVD